MSLQLPDDFLDVAFPKVARLNGQSFYYLWVFDPQSGKVIVEDNKDKPRVEHRYHEELAEEIPHPDRVHGYAYPIEGGYRVTDTKHKALDDQYVLNAVVKALDHRHYQHHRKNR